MPSPSFRRFAWTLFEPTGAEHSHIDSLVDSGSARYVCYGGEICPTTSRFHLQGYIEFGEKLTFFAAKERLGSARVHLSKALRSADDNRAYCSKDGDFTEWGESGGDGSSSGKLGGDKEIRRWDAARLAATTGAWAEIPSDIYVRYHASLHAIYEEFRWADRGTILPLVQLRPWQADIVDKLGQQPSDREIYFVVDVQGGAGKSSLARHLRSTMGAGVQLLRTGRHQDLAYAFRPGTKCLLVDVARASSEFIPYGFLEEVKDGYIFSTKYVPLEKVFPTPHVVVFCNVFPDLTKLSEDRFIIITL